ncbi:hypothetical protein VDG1235_4471 [Verrucomicrobiia bacterium DG1235]|nr:hypothetical protein VDG1235_4471 [Verrucomicrobiae bacterium DG1235]
MPSASFVLKKMHSGQRSQTTEAPQNAMAQNLPQPLHDKSLYSAIRSRICRNSRRLD